MISRAEGLQFQLNADDEWEVDNLRLRKLFKLLLASAFVGSAFGFYGGLQVAEFLEESKAKMKEKRKMISAALLATAGTTLTLGCGALYFNSRWRSRD